MDKNKKTAEDDLEEKDVIIGAEEADDEIEDDDLEEDDSYEEEAEEEEEEEEERGLESKLGVSGCNVQERRRIG